MDALAQAAEERIRKGCEQRMAALRRWFHGKPGENTCPCCFGTWISILFTDGWESLRCCECGAEGPLPLREVPHIADREVTVHMTYHIAPATKPEQTQFPGRQRVYMPNVAW